MFNSKIGFRRRERMRLPLRCAILIGFCLTSICGATTVVPPEFPTLVNESDYIIHAVVKSVSSSKQPTRTGGKKIITRVELDVVEVVAGQPPEPVVLELLGGRVGDEEMRVEGMPQFHVGDEDILFVRDNGTTICPLYGMMHGRYAIEKSPARGKKQVIRADGAPLRNTAQISAPLLERGDHEVSVSDTRSASATPALEPAEFIRQIKASVKPTARVNRAK